MGTVTTEQSEVLAQEHRLIARAQQGDRPAFAALVERYWERIYRWLYHLTHDAHAAEDLAQETFLKAYTGLSRTRPGTNFGAWLFRIAHNNCANHRRSSRHHEPLPLELPDSEREPSAQAASREAVADLARVIEQLPVEFRGPLLLRIEGGLSFGEIGTVLDITEVTARWRVFKARQLLLALLEPRPEEEAP